MPNFSEYLRARHAYAGAIVNDVTMAAMAKDWRKEVRNEIKGLEDLLPPDTPHFFRKAITTLVENQLREHSAEAAVAALDRMYDVLHRAVVKVMATRVRFAGQRLLGAEYPFAGGRRGGVEVAVFLKKASGAPEAYGREGGHWHDPGRTTAASLHALQTKLNALPWLGAVLPAGQVATDLWAMHGKKLTEPHAEDVWMAEHSERLMHAIEAAHAGGELGDNAPLDERFWVSELAPRRPHLRIVTTTACCTGCQEHFKAMRLALEARGIHLPILIFHKQPWQRGERPFGISRVTATGEYQDTGLHWSRVVTPAAPLASVVEYMLAHAATESVRASTPDKVRHWYLVMAMLPHVSMHYELAILPVIGPICWAFAQIGARHIDLEALPKLIPPGVPLEVYQDAIQCVLHEMRGERAAVASSSITSAELNAHARSLGVEPEGLKEEAQQVVKALACWHEGIFKIRAKSKVERLPDEDEPDDDFDDKDEVEAYGSDESDGPCAPEGASAAAASYKHSS